MYTHRGSNESTSSSKTYLRSPLSLPWFLTRITTNRESSSHLLLRRSTLLTSDRAIVDHNLRPKAAYYAVKRELAQITVSSKRTTALGVEVDVINSDKKAQGLDSMELWASNLSIHGIDVVLRLNAWDVITGDAIDVFTDTRKDYRLGANRSTEMCKIAIPVNSSAPNDHYRTVVALYLHDESSGEQIARHVNWPEPLKYVQLQQPRDLSIHFSPHERDTLLGEVQLTSAVPVKGVVLNSFDDSVKWEDNCVDLVPGEVTKIAVKGLTEATAKSLNVRYLGMK
jgi:beta-mannosidase